MMLAFFKDEEEAMRPLTPQDMNLHVPHVGPIWCERVPTVMKSFTHNKTF